jgi:polyamine oxidase
MSIDERGFKTIIQQEAEEFLAPDQLLLNSIVTSISYSGDGVSVTLKDGSVLVADYALVTFSLGVLQHDDVKFQPELPMWKQEAIDSMTMVDTLFFLIVGCT